jgi:hypothetical protein
MTVSMRSRIRNLLDKACMLACSRPFVRAVKDRTNFDRWQDLGLHVTPVHFHQPVPDTRTLKEMLWERESALIGIDWAVSRQLDFLEDVIPAYADELAFPGSATGVPHEFHRKNGAFLSVDAEIYHCMIRHFKPKKIVEVGSGATTYLAARACRYNIERDRKATELYAIDPFPNPIVRKGFPGLTRLIDKRIQDVGVDFFSTLAANDILFIDSSHVATIGSDVNYELLEIVPGLRKGVIVHVHDIFLPLEYPKKWVFEDKFFWNEQYLLQAFLSFNRTFEILWGSSFMHRHHLDLLQKVFPSCQKLKEDYPAYPRVWPSSFWFQRTKD